MKKLSLILILFLASCNNSSGGANIDQPVTPLVKVETLETTAQVNLGQFDLNSDSNYFGTDEVWFNLLSSGEINGDGNDDLVVGLMRIDYNKNPSGAITPVILMFDNSNFKFQTDKQIQSVLSKNQHPRQAAITDIDGDGRSDIFIADHGYDDAPYGAQNTLLLNKNSGFVNATNMLPQYSDYSHGIIIDDFDINGRKDILVINNFLTSDTKCNLVPGFNDCGDSSGKRVMESYVLFNEVKLRQGTFSLSKFNDINFTSTDNLIDNRLTVGSSSDFNKDGVPDLVVADNSKIKILESDGVAKYKPSILFYPSDDFKKFCGSNPLPYSYISTQDLNADGVNEIIASYSCSWNYNEFQVLRKNNEAWKDVTSDYFSDQSINRKNQDGWCYKIIFEDLDLDGKKDLICNSGRGFGWETNNVIWMNTSGKFVYKDLQFVNRRSSGWHTPVTLNSHRYIIGLVKSGSKVDVVGWKIR